MNPRLVPIILFAVILCHLSAHAEPPNTTEARLDGVWVLEAVEQVGMKLEGDQLPVRLRGMTRTIDGKRMTVSSSGREYQCSFTVDNTAKPKRIDISLKKEGRATQMLKGIYQIKGDTLQIAEDSRTRPTSFNTDKETRSIVYTFKRSRN